MKKQKKNKVLIGRVFDLFIIPVYIIVSVLLMYMIQSYTSKYTLLIVALLALILLIALVSMFYKKLWIHVIRRILLLLLCAGMIFGLLKINTFNRFFDRLGVDDNEVELITTQLNIYSLKSNENFTAVVESMDDLEGKTLGIQVSNDKDESNYVLEQVQKEYDVTPTEYNDYKKMMSDLYYGYVDAVVVNTNATKGIEDTFGPLDEFTNKIKTYTHKVERQTNAVDKDISKEIFTVLISGQDDVGTPNANSLSDVNMVAIVNPVSNQITIVSIPRDSFIPNPSYNYALDKLTHTGNDGVENTMAAIEATLQIDIDFYVKVSFTSLIEIVDAIGGVDVNVPIAFEEQDENRSFEQEDLITLAAGPQSLNGKEALAFARHRHSYVNQDLGRSQAQVQVIKGIISKLLTPEGLTSRIDKVLDIVPNYVLTNFTNAQMKSFIKTQIDDIKPWAVSTLSLANGFAPGPEGYIPTATDPTVNQSIYYLKRQEVFNVNAFSNIIKEAHKFSDFSFDASNLYEGLDTYDETKYDIEFAE